MCGELVPGDVTNGSQVPSHIPTSGFPPKVKRTATGCNISSSRPGGVGYWGGLVAIFDGWHETFHTLRLRVETGDPGTEK